MDAAGTYLDFMKKHEECFSPEKLFAQAQMSELFNLGTATRTVVLRAFGTQTATEMTSYHFFHCIFVRFLECLLNTFK